MVGLAACGEDGGSASPEEDVKHTVSEFIEALIAGQSGKACAMTTDVETCLSGLVAAQGFLGEGGYEALLGEDWRDELENVEVTFADDDHPQCRLSAPTTMGPPSYSSARTANG